MAGKAIRKQNCSGHIHYEDDIENHLANNLRELQRDLRDPPDGCMRQRHVQSGILDLLTVDSRDRRVVVEIKLGTAERDALGQLLSYMHDIDQTHRHDTSGIIVAEEFSDKLWRAADYCEDVRLYQYSIDINYSRYC